MRPSWHHDHDPKHEPVMLLYKTITQPKTMPVAALLQACSLTVIKPKCKMCSHCLSWLNDNLSATSCQNAWCRLIASKSVLVYHFTISTTINSSLACIPSFLKFAHLNIRFLLHLEIFGLVKLFRSTKTCNWITLLPITELHWMPN